VGSISPISPVDPSGSLDSVSALRNLLQEAIEAVPPDGRVVILGCGSLFRGDDAAGSLIAMRLEDINDRADSKACSLIGDVAPENQTGAIKQLDPDLVLIIDAVDMGLDPGEARVISPDTIGGVSFSTHMLPLPIMLDYLSRELGCRILLLGIQVASLEFMASMTAEVAKTVEDLTAVLRDLLVSFCSLRQRHCY